MSLFPDREIQQGEPCPWCRKTVGEVLTSAPPRCPQCKGFLAPALSDPYGRQWVELPRVDSAGWPLRDGPETT